MNPQLHRPKSLDEALSLLDAFDEAMVYGGGTAIQILIKQGVLFAEHLIDIGGVPGLDAITETDQGFRLGAMVAIRKVETDPRIRSRAMLAAEAYGRVANPRIRNTASVGGNISHGDYRLDPPTALMALDSAVEIASVRGVRTVPAREFFVDFQQTALQPGEMVTAITVPAAPVGSGCGYAKMSSLAINDWPVASVAALLEAAGPRPMLRLGVGALAPTPCHAELDVSGMDRNAVLHAGIAAVDALLDPIPDIRGTAGYKRRLGLVATEKAITTAWKDRNEH